ncbi:MAG: AMP-binding protein [Gammaproteobacteria bacterium]|nr:AMP-binding protein [Gammaproteobacteria bacterium]
MRDVPEDQGLRVNLLESLVARSRASTPEIFEARAAQTPGALFVMHEGRRWTYAEAWCAIGQYAALFTDLREKSGLERDGFRVASFLSNRPESLWCWFGAHASGHVYVSLNRSHKGELLADLLGRSGAKVLVTEVSALDALPDLNAVGIETLVLCDPANGWRTDGVRVVASDDLVRRAPRYGPYPAPSDLATIMFTSGTTGRSKAVRIPHNMLCRGGARVAEAFDFRATDVVHLWMPLFHIAGQLHQTMAMVVVGGALALYPTFSASQFWDQVRDSGATVFGGLPNVINILWKQKQTPNDARTTLRIGLVGMIPSEIHRAFEQRFGVRLCDTYGMTEMEPLTLPVAGVEMPLNSCGRAGADFEVIIVDDEGLPVPCGENGEIVARPRVPDVMMQGYEGDDGATVALWRNLWWHTGDLGYRDENGFFYVLGRKKHMIRRRGENISAWELESIIVKHPAVDECVALGVPSPLGEEDVKVVLVLNPEAHLDRDEFCEFCVSHMASFMRPRFVEFRDVFPLNDVGKVDKLELVDPVGEQWDLDPY